MMDESNDEQLTWILPGDNNVSSALDWTTTLKREKDRLYGMLFYEFPYAADS